MDQMGLFGRRRDKGHSKAFGLSHHLDGLPSSELSVNTGFWYVKDKMQQTIKEMTLFSLLQ